MHVSHNPYKLTDSISNHGYIMPEDVLPEMASWRSGARSCNAIVATGASDTSAENCKRVSNASMLVNERAACTTSSAVFDEPWRELTVPQLEVKALIVARSRMQASTVGAVQRTLIA